MSSPLDTIYDQFSSRTMTWAGHVLIRADAGKGLIDACEDSKINILGLEGFRVTEDEKRRPLMPLIIEPSSDKPASEWTAMVREKAEKSRERLERRLKIFEDHETIYLEFVLQDKSGESRVG